MQLDIGRKMVSSFAEATLSKLSADLALRATTQIFGRLRRILAMQRAFRLSAAPDPSASLEKELARVVGTEGYLTEPIALTLSDLSECGLLGHLAFIAAAKGKPDSSRYLFKALYSRHTTDGDCDALFDKLFAALTAAAQPNQLLEVSIQAQHEAERIESEIKRNLLKFDRTTKSVLAVENWRKKDPGLFCSADALESVRIAIAREHIVRCENIELHDPRGGTNLVPLRHAYVSLDLIESRDPKVRAQDNASARIYGGAADPEAAASILGVVDGLIVLGDPGGGKTTLVHKHCLDLAEAAVEGRGQVPILVKLREFDASRARGNVNDLLDFMVSDLREASPDISDLEIRTALHHLFVFGRCQVVLDGLDEVLSSPRRIQVRNIIHRFASRYPCCPIIVTSRINGYNVAPLVGFVAFQVASLEEPQIKQLHKALLVFAFKKSPKEATEAYPAFIEEGRRAASEFIGNPLLLSLIVVLYHQYREIPDERARLYDACARLLYDRWDGYRNIDPRLPEKHSLFPLLAHVAAEMYTNPELGSRLSRRELRRTVELFFTREFPKEGAGRARELAEAFVEHLTGRAWILREVGLDVFEFTHRTFMEYFFARYLDDAYDSIESLFATLLPKLDEWIIASHLAIQLKTREKRASSAKVVSLTRIPRMRPQF
jgi:hypothetical protein